LLAFIATKTTSVGRFYLAGKPALEVHMIMKMIALIMTTSPGQIVSDTVLRTKITGVTYRHVIRFVDDLV
jgi:hypothetical protein